MKNHAKVLLFYDIRKLFEKKVSARKLAGSKRSEYYYINKGILPSSLRKRNLSVSKMTLCFSDYLRIAYFGRMSGVMEKNEAVNVLLSCIQWNSEMFTFEIEEN